MTTIPRCAAISAALLLAGCDRSPTDTGPRVAVVEITGLPAPYLILRKGETLQLSAIARDSGGGTLNRPIVWSANPLTSAVEVGSAVVDELGRLTGVTAGWVIVSACADEVCASVNLYVRNPIAPITFGVDSLRMVLGSVRRLTVNARDADGKPIPVPVPIDFKSADASVAVVDTAGNVTAVTEGRTLVEAIGDDVTGTIPVRAEVVTYSSLSLGSSFTCGLTAAGEALCWGRNSNSQLGTVTPIRCVGSGGQYCAQSDSEYPVFVNGTHRFTQLAAGERHACGLTESGAVYCWGGNGVGQLGTTATLAYCSDNILGQSGPCSATPILLQGAPSFAAITAGMSHTCGLTPEGAAYCWGNGRGGLLGNGSTSSSATPVAVAGEITFRQMNAGWTHTCAVTEANEAFCWGLNLVGNLGIGKADSVAYTSPVRVQGGHQFALVAPGPFATCGVRTDGRVFCWGKDYMLGTTSGLESCPELSGSGWLVLAGQCATLPVAIASDLSFTTLAVAGSQACSLTTEGIAHCWGFEFRLPTTATALPPLQTISIGHYSRGCGVSKEGVAYCWGPNLVAERAPGQP